MGPNENGQKHIRSFWPIVVVAVVAFILGGLIFWFKFELTTDYELQSMEIHVHRRGALSSGQESKTSAKIKVSTSSPETAVPAEK